MDARGSGGGGGGAGQAYRLARAYGVPVVARGGRFDAHTPALVRWTWSGRGRTRRPTRRRSANARPAALGRRSGAAGAKPAPIANQGFEQPVPRWTRRLPPAWPGAQGRAEASRPPVAQAPYPPPSSTPSGPAKRAPRRRPSRVPRARSPRRTCPRSPRSGRRPRAWTQAARALSGDAVEGVAQAAAGATTPSAAHGAWEARARGRGRGDPRHEPGGEGKRRPGLPWRGAVVPGRPRAEGGAGNAGAGRVGEGRAGGEGRKTMHEASSRGGIERGRPKAGGCGLSLGRSR